MKRKKKMSVSEMDTSLNMVEHKSVGDHIADVIIYVVVALIALACVIPMWHVLMISLSDGRQAMAYEGLMWKWLGDFNLKGYELIFQDASIISGYANTIIYTVCATALGFVLAAITGYALSRDTKLKTPISLILMSTMLFSGGMVPTYIVIRYLGWVGTRWALIIPGCTNAMFMIMMMTPLIRCPMRCTRRPGSTGRAFSDHVAGHAAPGHESGLCHYPKQCGYAVELLAAGFHLCDQQEGSVAPAAVDQTDYRG